jgi:hypothetical protein
MAGREFAVLLLQNLLSAAAKPARRKGSSRHSLVFFLQKTTETESRQKRGPEASARALDLEPKWRPSSRRFAEPGATRHILPH